MSIRFVLQNIIEKLDGQTERGEAKTQTGRDRHREAYRRTATYKGMDTERD